MKFVTLNSISVSATFVRVRGVSRMRTASIPQMAMRPHRARRDVQVIYREIKSDI